MNTLFIYSVDDIYSPDRPLRGEGEMQFGISYISSCLKNAGSGTRLLIISRMLGGKNLGKIDEYIKGFSPKLVGFTSVSTEYPFITELARYIKNRYPHLFLLVGGPHVSLNPEEAISGGFDGVCVGEGEYPALELAAQLENGKYPSNIPNLWIRNGQRIEKNPPRSFLQDLDGLPFPDRAMWQDWIAEGPGSESPILLGRGCPFQCTYCCNHALRRVSDGSYVRLRSPDNIVSEIESLAAASPVRRDFYLEVETIGADKGWVIELCSKLERLNASFEAPLTYRTNLRITPNLDLKTLFSAFKKANFTAINIGVESGSERVRREILKRNYSNEDVVTAVSSARKEGLKVYFYNLIGVPGETLSDFKETVRINRLCQPDRTFNHIFYPYPGTELYHLAQKQGLLKGRPDTDLERCKATLDLPGFSRGQIRRGFIWFDYDVYRGHRPICSILRKVLVSMFRTNSRLHSLYRRFTYSSLIRNLRRFLK